MKLDGVVGSWICSYLPTIKARLPPLDTHSPLNTFRYLSSLFPNVAAPYY